MPPTKSKITELEAELYKARAERDDFRKQLSAVHDMFDRLREEREVHKASARAYCKTLGKARAQNSELHRIIDEAKEILSRAIVLERRPPSLKNYAAAAVERITFKIGLGKGWTCRNCAYYEPAHESLGECRRHPPTFNEELGTGFITTIPDDYCAEHSGYRDALRSARTPDGIDSHVRKVIDILLSR